MSEPIKHHFFPQFHLKAWADPDGKVPTLMRGVDGTIKHVRFMPNATAYENRLYSYEKVPPAQQQAVEKLYFAKEVDDRAADVHRKLLSGAPLSEEEREIWCRYLVAARLRVPEIVKQLKSSAAGELGASLDRDHDQYLAARGSVQDPTLRQWTERRFVGLIDNFGMSILPDIIDDPNISRVILDMNWWVEDVSWSMVPLVASDRPLVVYLGIRDEKCILSIPLSPSRLFIATRNKAVKPALAKAGPNELARQANIGAVNQADRFVYGHAGKLFVERYWNPAGRVATP